MFKQFISILFGLFIILFFYSCSDDGTITLIPDSPIKPISSVTNTPPTTNAMAEYKIITMTLDSSADPLMSNGVKLMGFSMLNIEPEILTFYQNEWQILSIWSLTGTNNWMTPGPDNTYSIKIALKMESLSNNCYFLDFKYVNCTPGSPATWANKIGNDSFPINGASVNTWINAENGTSMGDTAWSADPSFRITWTNATACPTAFTNMVVSWDNELSTATIPTECSLTLHITNMNQYGVTTSSYTNLGITSDQGWTSTDNTSHFHQTMATPASSYNDSLQGGTLIFNLTAPQGVPQGVNARIVCMNGNSLSSGFTTVDENNGWPVKESIFNMPASGSVCTITLGDIGGWL